jgi:hypothetical protein
MPTESLAPKTRYQLVELDTSRPHPYTREEDVEGNGVGAPHLSRRLTLIDGVVGPPAMGLHFFAVLVTSSL